MIGFPNMISMHDPPVQAGPYYHPDLVRKKSMGRFSGHVRVYNSLVIGISRDLARPKCFQDVQYTTLRCIMFSRHVLTPLKLYFVHPSSTQFFASRTTSALLQRVRLHDGSITPALQLSPYAAGITTDSTRIDQHVGGAGAAPRR
jgi:hypothetical protein